MIATIFTDISMSEAHRLATYAIWAKCNGVARRHCGVFKSFPPSTLEAECRALANGIAFAKLTFGLTKGDRIVAETDHAGVVQRITAEPCIRDETLACITQIASGLCLDLRYVKGHTDNRDARSAVNRWCDYAARKLLRARKAQPC